jgi:DNA-binding PadR family transcriptional regulator
MLHNGPRNGADIINEVGKASFGWWRPSPGSVYPLLEDLCQDGLIQKREDGKYEITDMGKEESSWSLGPWSNRPRSVEEMLNEIEAYASYFEDLAMSDKAKIEASSSRIRVVADRFSKLTSPS